MQRMLNGPSCPFWLWTAVLIAVPLLSTLCNQRRSFSSTENSLSGLFTSRTSGCLNTLTQMARGKTSSSHLWYVERLCTSLSGRPSWECLRGASTITGEFLAGKVTPERNPRHCRSSWRLLILLLDGWRTILHKVSRTVTFYKWQFVPICSYIHMLKLMDLSVMVLNQVHFSPSAPQKRAWVWS